MNDILSYWDLVLGLIVIIFGIIRRYKLFIYRKKRNDDILKQSNGKWKFSSYAKLKQESLEDSLCYCIITIGIVFIYNRLKGNLPNIVTLIKDLLNPY